MKHVVWAVAVVVLCAVAGGRAFQQATPAAPTAAILGRVVDAQSGQPIPGVTVGLVGTAPMPRGAPSERPLNVTVTTDEKGRFLFRSVPAGTYQLLARVGSNGYNASGFLVSGAGFLIGSYLDSGFGQHRPNGAPQPFIVKDGQQIPDAEIRMWKAGIVSGRVFDEAGEPLVRQVVGVVAVSSTGGLLNGPTMRTDDRGAFRFSGLMPGRYVVFVPQTQVSVPLALTEELAAGPPDPARFQRFNAANAPSPANGGVLAGNSLVSMVPDSARFGTRTPISNALAPVRRGDAVFVYPTTFHPSATSVADAERVRIAPGDVHENIDVRVQPVRATRVSGVVSDSAGPVPNMGVRLMPADQGDDAAILDAALTVTDPRGAFEFPVVPAGRYTLIVWRVGGPPGFRPGDTPARQSDEPGAWAMQPVTVGSAPIERLAVSLKSPVTVTGRVVFSGAGDRPPAERLKTGLALTIWRTQSLFRTPGPSSGSLIDPATGGITVRGLSPPGRYFVGPPSMPAPWTLESITLGGRDVTDAAIAIADADVDGLVVTYTDRPAVLNGTVAGAAGANHGVTVLLFPADRARWPDARLATRTFRSIRPSSDGAFNVQAILPGEYLAIAIRDELAIDWPDQSFLERVATAATAVRVSAAQQAAISLKVSELR